MNTIYTIILTIIGWQLVCVIVDLITNDDEDKVAIFAFGVWIPVSSAIGFVVKKFRLFRSRRYNCYQLYGKLSANGFANSWITNKYMTKEVANKYFIRQFDKDEEVTLSYSIRLLRTGKEFKSAPYKSDILTAKMLESGEPGLSPDFLKKFRQEV